MLRYTRNVLTQGFLSSSENNINAMQEVPLSKRNSVLLLFIVGLYLNVCMALPDVSKSRGLFISEIPFWRTAFGSWDSRTVHIPGIYPFTERARGSYDHVKKESFLKCKSQNPRTSAEKQTMQKWLENKTWTMAIPMGMQDGKGEISWIITHTKRTLGN